MKIRNVLFMFVCNLVLSLVMTGCSQTGADAAADLEQQAKEILAAYSAHDVDKIVSFMAEDLEFFGTDGGSQKGLDFFRKNLEELFLGFPDLKMEPVAVFAQGNRVCAQWQATGTASGTGEGNEATAGKAVSVPGVTVSEWSDGKVVRSYIYYDMATILSQLGLLEPPAQAQE